MTTSHPVLNISAMDAYRCAAEFFGAVPASQEAILPFVSGMRAVCFGVEAGVLPEVEGAHLAALIEAARPVLMGIARDHARDDVRQASPYFWSLDPRQTLGHTQQTLALVKAWATPLHERSTWHPEFLAGSCAFVRLQANLFENVVWSERAYCGVFNQPDPIREQAEGLVVDNWSTPDAAVPHARTRH